MDVVFLDSLHLPLPLQAKHLETPTEIPLLTLTTLETTDQTMDLITDQAILPVDQTTTLPMDLITDQALTILITDLTLEATLLETAILTDLSTDLQILPAAIPITDLAIPPTTETPLLFLLALLILMLTPEPLTMVLLIIPSSPTNANSLSLATESDTTDVPLMLSSLPMDACNSLGVQSPLTPTAT